MICLGTTHFIWLDSVPGLDITDMHIDGFARFSKRNTIIAMSSGDLALWKVPQKDIDYLYSVKKYNGEPYNHVALLLIRENVVIAYGKEFGYQGLYVNYYITNDIVLVPTYNEPNDRIAIGIIQSLYPSHKAVGIGVRNLYENSGMIHCVTQQQPK